MNWKLIVALSGFGLVMGIATVFVVPPKIEPVLWLVIFGLCAFVIARSVPAKHFLHGLCVSLVNCIWITGAHIAFYEQYLATHPDEAAMVSSMPLPGRLMMLVTGPLVGLLSGLVLGLFAFVASKLVKPKAA
jgi:hypothetical protein